MAVLSTKWSEQNAQQYYFYVNLHSAALYKTWQIQSTRRCSHYGEEGEWSTFAGSNYEDMETSLLSNESISLPVSHLVKAIIPFLQPGYFLRWLMAESWVEVNSGGSVASPQKWRGEELIQRASVDIVQCIFNCICRLAGISPDTGSCYPSAYCSLSWVMLPQPLASLAPKWDAHGAFARNSTTLSVTPAPSSRGGCVFQPRCAHGGATG